MQPLCGSDPQHTKIEASVGRFIPSQAADINIIEARCVKRHRIDLLGRIILKNNTGELAECLADVSKFHIMFKFHIDRFTVTAVHRNTNRCRRDTHFRIRENLLGFIDHLHFFLCIKVIKEDINLRHKIQGQREMFGSTCAGEDMSSHFLAGSSFLNLAFQFIKTVLTGTRGRLISGYDDSFDACKIINRLQGHDHDDG